MLQCLTRFYIKLNLVSLKIMSNSVILKTRVVDKRNALHSLILNPSSLNISFSWDGLGKYQDTLFCGVNKTERTRHSFFQFTYSMMERFVTIETVDTAVRVFARTQNIELSANKYKLYLVSSNLVDVAKKDLVTAKWRAVVVEPCAITSFEIGTAENPNESDRLLHFFYGEIGTGAADMSDVLGGSVAMNTGIITRKCDQIANSIVLLQKFLTRFFLANLLLL